MAEDTLLEEFISDLKQLIESDELIFQTDPDVLARFAAFNPVQIEATFSFLFNKLHELNDPGPLYVHQIQKQNAVALTAALIIEGDPLVDPGVERAISGLAPFTGKDVLVSIYTANAYNQDELAKVARLFSAVAVNGLKDVITGSPQQNQSILEKLNFGQDTIPSPSSRLRRFF